MIKYVGLINFIKNNIDCYGVGELFDIAIKTYGYDSSYDSFRKYVSRIRIDQNTKNVKATTPEKSLIDILKKQDKISISELCDILECDVYSLMEILKIYRYQGYDIYNDGQSFSLSKYKTSAELITTPLSDDKYIKFGVASDLHFGSTSCQITALKEFGNECYKQGIQHILVPGDVCAGYKTYPGQEHDVYALTSEEQEDSCLLNLPTGFDWWMLGGNHDYTFVSKGGGHNPILKLQHQRSDIHYLGFDKAILPLLPNVDCLLWHPSGGVPYSVSYRLQKGVEQTAFAELAAIANGNKPTTTIKFILAGHLHIQMQAMFGPIFGAQCGTFEGTTNYLVKKGLVPAIGGWIIEAWLGDNGRLKSFNAKFYMYEEIENDWKHYKHSIESSTKINTPIFC